MAADQSVLLLRVWTEESGLRARLVTGDGEDGEQHSVAVAQGVDEICDEVRRWLTGL